MSYNVNVDCHEGQERAIVRITGYSEQSSSARTSQLQCIGYLLDVRRLVLSKTEPEYVLNPNYLEKALVRFAGLTPTQADTLCRLATEKEAFDYAWSIISQKEQDLASTLNYKYTDNFWRDGLIPIIEVPEEVNIPEPAKIDWSEIDF